MKDNESGPVPAPESGPLHAPCSFCGIGVDGGLKERRGEGWTCRNTYGCRMRLAAKMAAISRALDEVGNLPMLHASITAIIEADRIDDEHPAPAAVGVSPTQPSETPFTVEANPGAAFDHVRVTVIPASQPASPSPARNSYCSGCGLLWDWIERNEGEHEPGCAWRPDSVGTTPTTSGADEIGWLIEIRGDGMMCRCGHNENWHSRGQTLVHVRSRCGMVNCDCRTYEPMGAPSWWDGERWTPDHLRALRFARKQDADRVIALKGWASWLGIVASEHMWASHSSLPAPDTAPTLYFCDACQEFSRPGKVAACDHRCLAGDPNSKMRPVAPWA